MNLAMPILFFSVALPARSAAFVSRISVRTSNSHNKLSAGGNFFSDLANTFSTMTNSGEKRNVYTVAITGSSGLVGKALIDEMSSRGSVKGKPVKIIRLSRGSARGDSSLSWDPKASSGVAIDPSLLEEVDTVVHLAGENVSTGEGILASLGIRPWTDSKKKEIINSRVEGTKALAAAVKEANKNGGGGRPQTDFLVASGPGIYGFEGIGPNAALCDESMDTSQTTGFLADVSREWESAAKEAVGDGAKGRVVQMRFGVVLSKLGGALAKLYPIFFVGGGGYVGSGDQYFPFISARDLARSIVHIIETPQLHGPVNMVAPTPCTNAEFTKVFGSVINRPTIFPLPSFAVKALFGQMGEEMLLGGQKVSPSKLVSSGFNFKHDTVEKALKSAIVEEQNI